MNPAGPNVIPGSTMTPGADPALAQALSNQNPFPNHCGSGFGSSTPSAGNVTAGTSAAGAFLGGTGGAIAGTSIGAAEGRSLGALAGLAAADGAMSGFNSFGLIGGALGALLGAAIGTVSQVNTVCSLP